MENINSNKEYEIYKEAGLEEKDVNGKPVLVREIDLDIKDEMGRTNKERMEEGLAPLENGKPIELHHIGQKSDSPLAELSIDEHRSKENDGILHDKTKESEINRNTFNTEKINHWKERIREMEN
ncbi:hypothetical protein HMPREF1983_00171 [Gemella bergeri ATCC 700627]|uniref:LHH domain-containing protein n=1 Tax=Gemella bergeri ATCC 700627 TaxID=1321820 RepID=U2QW35_9BACL|nr:hypothetical protein HMPREF1983_00171 [Gemella bergeri ATCC 700627]